MIKQSSVSYDPSEIIIITFLIIIDVENSCAASYFCGNCYIFYPGLFDEQHLFEIEIFCEVFHFY